MSKNQIFTVWMDGRYLICKLYPGEGPIRRLSVSGKYGIVYGTINLNEANIVFDNE